MSLQLQGDAILDEKWLLHVLEIDGQNLQEEKILKVKVKVDGAILKSRKEVDLIPYPKKHSKPRRETPWRWTQTSAPLKWRRENSWDIIVSERGIEENSKSPRYPQPLRADNH